MNAAGEILDPLGIRLPSVSLQTSRPNVVFLGDAYLVYWNEASLTAPYVTRVMGARISRDGVLLDSTPRMFAERAGINVVGAASNGNRVVLVFGESMIVLDRNANIVDGPRRLSPDSAGANTTTVASNGRDFLVLWQQGTFITSQRLDANGVAAVVWNEDDGLYAGRITLETTTWSLSGSRPTARCSISPTAFAWPGETRRASPGMACSTTWRCRRWSTTDG